MSKSKLTSCVEGGIAPRPAAGPSMRESGESPKMVRDLRLSGELTSVIFF